MKGTYIQKGDNLDYTNPTEETIEPGTLIFIGALAAVAAETIKPEETGAAATRGVFAFAKDTAEIAAGDKVYYDAAADTVTATETDAAAGIAVKDAAADDTAVYVRLNG